jgi:SAM-dependent methyltransferase
LGPGVNKSMESAAIETAQGLETMSEAMEGLQHYYDWLFATVSPFLGQRILEVGPGFGDLADRIRDTGRSYFAIYSNESVIKRLSDMRPHDAESFFVGDVTEARCRARLQSLGCDTVLSFNVIEHVEDDLGLLRAIGAIVPGGRVVVFVPALPALFGSFDRAVGHYRRYLRASLMAQMSNAGLKLKSCRYFNALGALSWFVATRILRLNPHQGSTKRSIRIYDRFVIPVARTLDPFFASIAGQSLLAVADAPEGISPVGRNDD